MAPPPPLCPDGHVSSSDDYCDVCGIPMQGGAGGVADPIAAAAAGSAPSPGGVPAAGGGAADVETRACPHCGAVSSASYLFCEDCGYDFTTGALPRPLTEGLIDTRVRPATESSAVREPVVPAEPVVAAEPEIAQPIVAQPEVPAPVQSGAAEPVPAAGPGPVTAEPATIAPVPHAPAPAPAPSVVPLPPTPMAAATATASVPSASPTVTGPRPANQAPSRRASGHWIVEIWIDPAWYEVQESDQACPSPAVPDVVPISGRALVGRYSASRHVVPEVDCGADSGVSRRHAEFTTDGRRWWVEDLGSSNGTFVGPASGPLPADPIPAGQRVEIDDDDRVYVGAWTRLVLRRATASEIAGQG